MLKAEIGGEVGRIEFKGSMWNAALESTYIIRNLYNIFLSESPISAMIFKELVKACVSDDSSPTWEKIGGHAGDGVKSVSIHFTDGSNGKEK